MLLVTRTIKNVFGFGWRLIYFPYLSILARKDPKTASCHIRWLWEWLCREGWERPGLVVGGQKNNRCCQKTEMIQHVLGVFLFHQNWTVPFFSQFSGSNMDSQHQQKCVLNRGVLPPWRASSISPTSPSSSWTGSSRGRPRPWSDGNRSGNDAKSGGMMGKSPPAQTLGRF